MRGKQTIIINGRSYDALTGMPVDTVKTQPEKQAAAKTAQPAPTAKQPAVQRQTGRALKHKQHHSKTLRRDIVKKPSGQHDSSAKHVPQHRRIAKSPQISKFAPHPAVRTASAAEPVEIPAVVAAAHAKSAARRQTKQPALSSRELKDHLIKQRLDQAPTRRTAAKPKKKRAPLRVSSVMAGCLGLMILGGYLSYINMPNLSVRVAAAQAGVDASYPGYTPSGYRFDGPVAYSNGTVSLSFAANGGFAAYEIGQKKSAWDSQALLDNYVAAKSGEAYEVNDTQGLTVYTYGSNAAWVNRGVLYTITGDAPLRTEQVLKIATSL